MSVICPICGRPAESKFQVNDVDKHGRVYVRYRCVHACHDRYLSAVGQSVAETKRVRKEIDRRWPIERTQ